MEPMTDKQREKWKRLGKELDKIVMEDMFGDAWNLKQFGVLPDDMCASGYEKLGACINDNKKTVELTWEETKRLLVHATVLNGEARIYERMLSDSHKHNDIWKEKYLALLKKTRSDAS